MSKKDLEKAIKDCEDRIAMNIIDRERLMGLRYVEYGIGTGYLYAKFDKGTYGVPDWRWELKKK